VIRGAPRGGDEAALLEPLQRRAERAVIDDEGRFSDRSWIARRCGDRARVRRSACAGSADRVALVAAGSLVGIGTTFALARIVRASGGAGGIYDPSWPAFVIPIAFVVAIGAVATWIPSRRAMKINPAILLRTT